MVSSELTATNGHGRGERPKPRIALVSSNARFHTNGVVRVDPAAERRDVSEVFAARKPLVQVSSPGR
jgi:hypothetical protein